MSNEMVLMTIAVAALVTLALRVLPFVLLGGKETPEYVLYLGRVLPYAIMAMLIVYCLKGISFTGGSHGIPEIAAVAAVAAIHAWKKNSLLSIVAGTALYMFLVQMVF